MKNSVFESKLSIRTIEIEGITIGGAKAPSFSPGCSTKPVIALDIPFFEDKNTAPILQEFYGKEFNFDKVYSFAQDSVANIICISFNIPESDTEKSIMAAIEGAAKYSKISRKPLIFRGTGNKNIDTVLLPELCKAAAKPVIIAYADENTYENIVPAVVKYNHYLVLRTPIDINLAKELNILSSDAGLSLDKILIDTDTGALGYGIDYGYSITEKIKQAAFEGDAMLNMPTVAFIGYETYKVRETKTESKNPNDGKYEQRAVMWEISAVSAMINAGCDLAVCSHPKTVEIFGRMLWN